MVNDPPSLKIVPPISTLEVGEAGWGFFSLIHSHLVNAGFESRVINGLIDLSENQYNLMALEKGPVTVYLELKTNDEGRFYLVVVFIGPMYERREAYDAVRAYYKQYSEKHNQPTT